MTKTTATMTITSQRLRGNGFTLTDMLHVENKIDASGGRVEKYVAVARRVGWSVWGMGRERARVKPPPPPPPPTVAYGTINLRRPDKNVASRVAARAA